MIIYRINKDLSVEELEVNNSDDWMDEDITWAVLSLDGKNDIYYDDEGLLQPGCVTARIGVHNHVPLPVFIVGTEEGKDVSCTIPKELVEASVT